MKRNKRYNYGWTLANIRSRHPIKMRLECIFQMYGLPLYSMDNTPDFVQFYEVEDGKAYNEITGQGKTEPKILIGYDSDYYWLPSDALIKTRHRCSILPGKCLYSTDKSWNLPKHEKRCTDQTKIKTKQVNSWSIWYGGPTVIFITI